MPFETTLLLALTISAPVALIAALVRLIALFTAPYIDPIQTAKKRRGPRLRVWLLLVPLATLCVGGLAVYGLAMVLLDEALHWTLRLASYAGVVLVSGVGFSLIGLALGAQNRLALIHALETRRPGEAGRSIRSANLLEIGVLFAFATGFILLSEFAIPDLREASLLPADDLQIRARLLNLIAYVTFFAGAAAVLHRALERISHKGGLFLSWLALPVALGVFRFIYESVAPSRSDLARYAKRPDSPDLAASTMTGVLHAEVLALIGLALVATLVAGPFLDRVLQRIDRDGRLSRRARLLFFMTALAAGVAFALLTPVAGLLTPSLVLPALVLAACGAAGSGLLRREPEIAEPVPVEVF